MRDRLTSFRPTLSFILLSLLFGLLWLGGGASRADAMGQVVARGAASAALLVAVLFSGRPRVAEMRVVASFLLAMLLLSLVQLIPLPPAIWQSLPGRALLADAARVSGQEQPWRPLSIVPGATINAASSLIVPFATLVLLAGTSVSERQRLPGLLLILVTASTMFGLLQFTGAGVNNPLVNDTPGEVSGLFANRNHFALFAAMGCLLAPAWAFSGERRPQWRAPTALALILLFVLIILASGSRAGMILGVLGIVIGLFMVWQGIRKELKRFPRWVFPALLAGIAGMVAILVLISVIAKRAVSIDRAFAIDPGQDMRARGFPTVLAMIKDYFPVGSGLGGFDPVFRIHEPFHLLKLTYFNHAHNDFLEIVLDAGLPGLLLLVTAFIWWAWASVQAWRSPQALPKLGSGILLLVMIASVFDYPARTPLIMATILVSAVWLEARVTGRGGSALPETEQHL